MTFAAYFAILTAKDIPDRIDALLLISCLGSVFSVSWYLVNRASKFWQENWEAHVDLLEDGVVGPLYKIVLQDSTLKKSNWLGPFLFSVTKINLILSIFVVLLFFFLLVVTLVRCYHFGSKIFASIVLTLTVAAIALLWRRGTTDLAPRTINATERTPELKV